MDIAWLTYICVRAWISLNNIYLPDLVISHASHSVENEGSKGNQGRKPSHTLSLYTYINIEYQVQMHEIVSLLDQVDEFTHK